ncbi:MAG TPA: C40 family peptidase [Flavobacterium sp.]|uniref:C40 family peptidase n=1 Tax=Flavobacterium sp. TaxID=239 RepID=UPI002F3F7E18
MKQLLYISLLIVLFTSCKPSSAIVTSTEKSPAKNIINLSSRKTNKLIDGIIDSASKNIGIKYKTAGTTTSGYDCSGLVCSTFGMFDIKLPRTSIEQSRTGIDLGKNTDEAKKGDLIFFKTNNRSQINHVGIVIEANDDEILFIHTSTSKGVIISSTKEPYYRKTFAQLNRILE